MLRALLFFHLLVNIPSPNPFTFFEPTVTMTAGDLEQLDNGYPVARILPSRGLEDGVFAAVRIGVDGDRLAAWTRRIEELKKGPYVLAIGRFSDPPRIEDLKNLSLDPGDLDALRTCHPGKCGLKLSAREMMQLHEVMERAGNEWEAPVQQAFRQVILSRLQLYLAEKKIPPYEDHQVTVYPASRLAWLAEHTTFLTSHAPQIVEYLRGNAALPPDESLAYWSKERVSGKAIISVTHVNIFRKRIPGLPTLVVSNDVFSTHYIDASLSVTALVRGASSQDNFLVYVNRTEVDVLHGPFSPVIRRTIEGRLKSGASSALERTRQRLESGNPPG